MIIQYALRRVVAAIPVLLGILLVTFVLARVIPGDPCRAILGEKATEAVCSKFIEAKGLNKPIIVQFGIYAKDMISGNLGDSYRLGMPVTRLLIERLPTTFELSLAALIVSVILGIPLGIISAVKHNTWLDVGTMVWANVGVSMPVFWLGLMLAYIFSLTLKGTPFWLPPSGRVSPEIISTPFYQVWGWTLPESGLWSAFLNFSGRLNILNALLTQNWALLKDSIAHLILPAFALGTIPMAIVARMTRSTMLDALGQDYIRTARAKGLREIAIVFRHAFRNSLLPLVTVIGLSFGGLLGGAVLTETVFGLSGVGRTLFEAITARDYGVVQTFTLIIAVGFVIINLLVDISYVYLDPRVRLK
ncbi:MAG: ABC transporter permease [Anaerolineales bacterium]|nr:ABC transporter permease [Anaerolineales bacterium]